MRNPDEPPIYATRRGSQGSRLLESPNKEHRVGAGLVEVGPILIGGVPAQRGLSRVLTGTPDIFIFES